MSRLAGAMSSAAASATASAPTPQTAASAEAPAGAPAGAPDTAPPTEAPKKKELSEKIFGPALDEKFGDGEAVNILPEEDGGYCFLVCSSTKKRWENMIEKYYAERYKFWKGQTTDGPCAACCNCCAKCCGGGKPLSEEEIRRRVERDVAEYIDALRKELKLVQLTFNLPPKNKEEAAVFDDYLMPTADAAAEHPGAKGLEAYRTLMVFQFTNKGLYKIGLPNYTFNAPQVKVPVPFYTTTLSGGLKVLFNKGLQTHIKTDDTKEGKPIYEDDGSQMMLGGKPVMMPHIDFQYEPLPDKTQTAMFLDFKTSRYLVQSILQDLPMVVSDAESHQKMKTVTLNMCQERSALEFPWNGPEVFVYTDMVDEFTTLKRVSEFLALDFSGDTADIKSAFDERLAAEIEGGGMDKSFYSYLLYLNGALQFPGAWALMPYVKQAHINLREKMWATADEKKQKFTTTSFEDQRKAFNDLYRPPLRANVNAGKSLTASSGEGKEAIYRIFVTEACTRPKQIDLKGELEIFWNRLGGSGGLLGSPPAMQILMTSCFEYVDAIGKCMPVNQKKGLKLVETRIKAINHLTGWKLKAKEVADTYILISDTAGKFGEYVKEAELKAAGQAAATKVMADLKEAKTACTLQFYVKEDTNEKGETFKTHSPWSDASTTTVANTIVDQNQTAPEGVEKIELTNKGKAMQDIKVGNELLTVEKGSKLHIADEGCAVLLLGGKTYGTIKLGQEEEDPEDEAKPADSKAADSATGDESKKLDPKFYRIGCTLTESMPADQEPTNLVGFIDKHGVPQCKKLEEEQEKFFEEKWNPAAEENKKAFIEWQEQTPKSTKLMSHEKGKKKAEDAAKAGTLLPQGDGYAGAPGKARPAEDGEGSKPVNFKSWEEVQMGIITKVNANDYGDLTKAAVEKAVEVAEGGVKPNYKGNVKKNDASPDGSSFAEQFEVVLNQMVTPEKGAGGHTLQEIREGHLAKEKADAIVDKTLMKFTAQGVVEKGGKVVPDKFMTPDAMNKMKHEIEMIVHDAAGGHATLATFDELGKAKHVTKGSQTLSIAELSDRSKQLAMPKLSEEKKAKLDLATIDDLTPRTTEAILKRKEGKDDEKTITVVPPDPRSESAFCQYMIVAGRVGGNIKPSSFTVLEKGCDDKSDSLEAEGWPSFSCTLEQHIGSLPDEDVLNSWGLTKGAAQFVSKESDSVYQEVNEELTTEPKSIDYKVTTEKITRKCPTDELVDVKDIVLYAIPCEVDKNTFKVKLPGNESLHKDVWLASYNWKATSIYTKTNKAAEANESLLLKTLYGVGDAPGTKEGAIANPAMDLSPLLFTSKDTLMWIDVMQHMNIGAITAPIVRSMVYLYKNFNTLPLYIMPKKMGGDDPEKAAGRGWITQECSNGLYTADITKKIGESKKGTVGTNARLLEFAFKLQRMKDIIAESSVSAGADMSCKGLDDLPEDEGNEGKAGAKSGESAELESPFASYTPEQEQAALDTVANAPKVALQVVRALARARFGVTTEMDRYVATPKWAGTLGCFKGLIASNMFEQPIGKISVKKYAVKDFGNYDPEFVYGVDTYACCGCCCVGVPNPFRAKPIENLSKLVYRQEEFDVADMQKGARWNKGMRRLLLLALTEAPCITSSLTNYRLINSLGLGRLNLFKEEDLIHGARRVKVPSEDVKEVNEVLKAGGHGSCEDTLTVRIVGSSLCIWAGKTEKGGMLTSVKSHEVDEDGLKFMSSKYVG